MPITVSLAPNLRVHRGKLSPHGAEVHAATFLRQRRILLDRALLGKPRELRRIFLHELFHFVWYKLGNPRRLSWERLLAAELSRRARGELGWSAELRKSALSPTSPSTRNRPWREYCCESFCDSGASLLLRARTHPEFTLAPQFTARRHAWFQQEAIIRNEEDLVQFVAPKNGRSGFVWLADMPCLLPPQTHQRPAGQRIEGPQRGS